MLLAVSVLFVQQASAQLKFGVQGGISVSKISFDNDLFDSNNRTGWYMGPTLRLGLPLPGLSLDASALYEQQSSKVEDMTRQGGETTVKHKQVVFPINARYGFGLGSLVDLFVFAGPRFGFNVGDREFSWNDKADYTNTFQLKKSNLSVNVGVGASLINHLQFSAGYNIAVGKTGEAQVRNVVNDTYDAVTDGKTNAWQVSMTYFF